MSKNLAINAIANMYGYDGMLSRGSQGGVAKGRQGDPGYGVMEILRGGYVIKVRSLCCS
jgi:hypothetical protein